MSAPGAEVPISNPNDESRSLIVGNGLLARSFAPLYASVEDVVIFASGVSNSSELRGEQFNREKELLASALADGQRRLVYFSSCGLADAGESSRPYMLHKRAMESMVLATAGGRVLRLPQVVGVTPNPHTLTNYLRDKIVKGERFAIWANAERNLIDVDDLVAIGSAMIDNWPGADRVLPVAARHSTPMPEIVSIFEQTLGRKANCVLEDKGSPMTVDARIAGDIGARMGIDLNEGYCERVIRKYYGPGQRN